MGGLVVLGGFESLRNKVRFRALLPIVCELACVGVDGLLVLWLFGQFYEFKEVWGCRGKVGV